MFNWKYQISKYLGTCISSNEIKFIYNQGRNYNVYSNINYETYIDNVFMKITLGNTTNKSGLNKYYWVNGDNVEITDQPIY